MSETPEFKVRVFLGSEPLFSLVVKDTPVAIGRSSTCDIVLPLPDVSRLHAVLDRKHGEFFIEDRSRNGIAVNGVRVRTSRISDGDEVQIAGYALRFGGETGVATGGREVETRETSPIHPLVVGSGVGTGAIEQSFEMVGASDPMRQVYAQIRKIAGSPHPVLILGETGTGKELVARALHSLGPTSQHPWVVVNCAAIAPDLVESELFGHERGAFTGAIQKRDGAFVAAQGGSLFLDEVGEMPPAVQPKLLRALENFEVQRVGGATTLKVNARVIAATNRDLAKDVDRGRFRRDLFFRFILRIVLPPLRHRRDDVVLLLRHFLAEEAARPLLEFRPDALAFLQDYSWPGNVRELRNLIRRLVVEGPPSPVGLGVVRQALELERLRENPDLEASLTPGRSIAPEGTARLGEVRSSRGHTEGSEPGTLREIERKSILRALQDCDWNKKAAAGRLGISRASLYQKIKLYGLSKD